MNMYGFVDNDSINYIDLFGLFNIERACYSDVWAGHADFDMLAEEAQWQRDKRKCDLLNIVACYTNINRRPIWPTKAARDRTREEGDSAPQGFPSDELMVDALYERIKVAQRLVGAQCSNAANCCDTVTIRVTCQESESMIATREAYPERMTKYCAYRNTYSCKTKQWENEEL